MYQIGAMLWIRTTGLLLQTVGTTQKVVGPAACRRYALFTTRKKRRSSDEQVKPIVPSYNAALQQIIETSFKQDM